MFVASYHNTMQGIQSRQIATKVEDEKSDRDDARRIRDIEVRRAAREAARIEEIAHRKKQAIEDIERANVVLARINGGPSVVSMAKIVRRICKALKVTKEELASPRRNRDVVLARQAIMYWTCRLTRMSTPEIGRRLDRDHTSVLHGRDTYPKKRAAMGRYLRPAR